MICSAPWRWFFDTDTTRAMVELRGSDPSSFKSMSDAHDRRVQRHREWWWAYLVGALIPLVLIVLGVHRVAPAVMPFLPHAAGAGLLVAAGIVGYAPRAPLPIHDGEVPAVSPQLVTDALCEAVARVRSKVRDDPKAVRFTGPAVRTPAGWRVEPILPGGATVDDVRANLSAVAAMLGRPRDVLVVSRGSSEAHVVLDVLDAPLRVQPAPAYPFFDGREVDAWSPQPLGVDHHGRVMSAPIIGRHWIVAGRSGTGKSTLILQRAVTAALDPLVELHVVDCGGAVDFGALRPVAATWRAGWDRDDQQAYDALVGRLEDEIARRRAYMASHVDEFPTGAVTRADCARLGWRGIVVLVDEAHVVMGDKGRADRLTQLVRVARKYAVTLWVATQYPDRTSLPPALSQQASLRTCLAVDTAGASNLTLGSDLAGQGYDASDLTAEDLGIAWTVGLGGRPQLVRHYFVTGAEARGIVSRAVERRPVLEVVDVEDEPVGILAELLDVWPDGEARMPWTDLAELLEERAPGRYAGADEIASAARAEGLSSVQVTRRIDGARTNRRGAALSDVCAIMGASQAA